ncbi:MAG: RdgB/HAM1 family non-canonical purine NTP pyrophosphatase [Candidatus Acidiferrales bacterium]
MPARDESAGRTPAPIKVLIASSNPGKLREYNLLAKDSPVELGLFPDFNQIPPYEESAPTFAENAAGKAQHYSCFASEIVLADDSGLVVPALGGAPGVQSARYAGPNATDQDRVRKLLREMEGKESDDRRAKFVCVMAIAREGRVLAVVSDSVAGVLTKDPRGKDGFGYDPVFYFENLGRTYAETTREEKNRYSHRGKAFRKMLAILTSPESFTLP